MAIYDNRICKQCGTTFSGGAHAFYCDICRVERSKELDRARKQRSRNGTARKTGSTVYNKPCNLLRNIFLFFLQKWLDKLQN